MDNFRKHRNRLLTECDWTILPSSPLSAEKQDEWKIYRQALRDLPASSTPTLGDMGELLLSSVTWPTEPS